MAASFGARADKTLEILGVVCRQTFAGDVCCGGSLAILRAPCLVDAGSLEVLCRNSVWTVKMGKKSAAMT